MIDPPLSSWSPQTPHRDRTTLRHIVNDHAQRLHTAALTITHPLIATGHQAWLWHPGILAKDIAMAAAARLHQSGMVHLIVDQDVNEALTLEVPVQEGNRLRVYPLRLAAQIAGVPTGVHPPIDPADVKQSLDDTRRSLGDSLCVDLSPIARAFVDLPACRSLAEQLAVVTVRLMRPWVGDVPVFFASDLPRLPGFAQIVRRMLDDPQKCVACYNQAAAARPEAGIAPLAVEPDRVELPLWVMHAGAPRRRVYADVADRRAILVNEDGEPLTPPSGVSLRREMGSQLAPKALLLTAIMRCEACDLFIHGKGGGEYDRITEDWWRAWTSEELAPTAVVSVDLYLDLKAPVAERGDLARAVWWQHHLPHNLDRALRLDDALARRKAELLSHMGGNRDRRRRATAFADLHAINARLVAEHPQAVHDAEQSVERAQAGVANRAISAKRDWCFALYADGQLAALMQALHAPSWGPARPAG
ncbi:MAG: hypothetical protein WD042_05395 [Phycisphaeraceae bacterium]